MSAWFSECGQYRYTLRRDLGVIDGEGTCAFVMLNPSVADAEHDDPTIRRCIRFARDWGCSRLVVVNLYAYRSTDPRQLRLVTDPVGPENDCVLAKTFGMYDLTVAAWGAHADSERVAQVMSWPMAPRHCLGVTMNGSPRHPLYVPADQPLIRYAAAGVSSSTGTPGEAGDGRG